MLALLLGAGFVYLALGVILPAFAILSIAITVVQEARMERVLEALRDLTSPRALVIRNGERKRIAGREVARGDLVALAHPRFLAQAPGSMRTSVRSRNTQWWINAAAACSPARITSALASNS